MKSKRLKMSICDRIELKRPFTLDISKVDKVVRDRLEYYSHQEITDEEISQDITLINIQRELHEPTYELRTSKLLEDFKILNMEEQRRRKDISDINKKVKTAQQKALNLLVDEYLVIAAEYIKIDIIPQNKKKANCPRCNGSLERVENDLNTGLMECVECGCEIQNFLFTPAIKDSNFTQSIGYENRDNFIKKMQRKQGKLFSKFHSTLLEDLDRAMRKRGYPTREEAKELAYNPQGEKEGTSLDMLVMVLGDIKYPKYYNDIDYIAHLYWGWTLLDFTALEGKLLEMYDNTQRVYNKIQDKERIAALNTEARLYLQLKSLGIKVSKSRFRFQESQESLEFHQSMWREMCDKAGYTYYSIF